MEALKSWSDKYLTLQTVTGLVGFVFATGVLYSEFKTMKIRDNELEEDINTQIELQERRSDNRFQRATEWNLERRREFEKLEERVRQLEKDVSFQKGSDK